jgi:hypothetical protein
MGTEREWSRLVRALDAKPDLELMKKNAEKLQKEYMEKDREAGKLRVQLYDMERKEGKDSPEYQTLKKRADYAAYESNQLAIKASAWAREVQRLTK